MIGTFDLAHREERDPLAIRRDDRLTKGADARERMSVQLIGLAHSKLKTLWGVADPDDPASTVRGNRGVMSLSIAVPPLPEVINNSG